MEIPLCKFIILGYREFGNSGYFRAVGNKTIPTSLDFVHSIRKKFGGVAPSAIVTGANSGIGYQVTYELARRGIKVFMVCRNEERGNGAKAELLERIRKEKPEFEPELNLCVVDVSRPGQLLSLSREWNDDLGRDLHVLVNNAGYLPTSENREMTQDGFESTFATNSLSTYCLTEWLAPVLKRTSDKLKENGIDFKPRVINVSSGGMYSEKLNGEDLNFDNMKKFDGVVTYAQTKRQQVEMTRHWGFNHRYREDIHFYSMHPGWTDTPGVQHSLPKFYEFMKGGLRTLEQGADTIVWAATAPENDLKPLENGCFLQDRKQVSTSLPLSQWTMSETSEVSSFMARMEKLKQQITSE